MSDEAEIGSRQSAAGDDIKAKLVAAYGPSILEETVPLPFSACLDQQLAIVRAMLLAKNEAYGNSALEPLRCFAKSDRVEQIKVRIDDKLSRLMRGAEAGEDVVLDLIGYLILLRIAGRTEG